MRASKFFPLATGLIFFLLVSALSLSAQVTYYGLEKNQFFSQTANNTAPGGPYEDSVYVFVDTTAPGQAGELTATDGSVVSNLTGSSTSFAGNEFYATKSAMDAAFPSGSNTTFAVSGGSLGSASQTIPVRADDYPQEIYVTDTAITDAQNLDANVSYTFNLGYTGPGTSTSTALAILNSAGSDVYVANGAADQSSFLVSSSVLETLVPGEDYTVELVDFNDVDAPASGGFGGAPNAEAFTDTTLFTLATASSTPVPEPSAWIMVLFALGLPLLIKVRENRVAVRVVSRINRLLP
jgi:hypothetical protein